MPEANGAPENASGYSFDIKQSGMSGAQSEQSMEEKRIAAFSTKEAAQPKEEKSEILTKVGDNFRALVRNTKGPLPDPKNLDELKKSLLLDENFTEEELERNCNIANDALDEFYLDDFRAGVFRRYLEVGYAELKKKITAEKTEVLEAKNIAAEPEKTVEKEVSDIGATAEFREFVERDLDYLVPELDKVLLANNTRLVALIEKTEPLSDDEKKELGELDFQNQKIEERLSGLDQMFKIRQEIISTEDEMKSLEESLKSRNQESYAEEKISQDEEEKLRSLQFKHKELRKKLFELYKKYSEVGKVVSIVPYVKRDSLSQQEKKIVAIEPYKEGEKHIEPYKEGEKHIVPKEEGEKHIVPVEEEKPEGEKRERIRIADVSEVVKAMAWRIAENRLNEIINMRNRERGVWNGITAFARSQMAKMGERGYLSKFYYEAIDEIRNNQDLMADIQGRMLGRSVGERRAGATADKAEQWQVLDAVIEQMEEEVLEDEEKGVDHLAVGNIFADLINRHTVGEFADRAAFEAAAREAIEQAIARGDIQRSQFSADPARANEAEGLMYASNLWQVAERQRQTIEAQFGEKGRFENLTKEQKESLIKAIGGIGNLDIQLANKLRDINEERPERPDQTRGYLRFFDRVANSLRGRPILGAIFNPTILGLSSSMVTRGVARSLLIGAATATGLAATGYFALPVAVGAALGGAFAYISRKRNLAYDRGVEQRREALGLQGEGRRAERLRDFGFSGLSREATELSAQINSGDQAAINEAAALLQVERELRREGRAVDLVTTTVEEGSQLGTNLRSKTELKIALNNHRDQIDQAVVDQRVAEIRAEIEQQDRNFESFRTKEAWKAGGYGAATAAVFGIAGSEAAHWCQNHFTHQVDRQITLFEYLRGQRPNIAHYELGGHSYQPGDTIHQHFTIGGHKVDVDYTLGKDGHLHVDPKTLPTGYTVEPSGRLVHHIPGVPGGRVTGESWTQFKNFVLQNHKDFDTSHVSWRGFAYNGTPPEGSSWLPFFVANANGTETMMHYAPSHDGSVIIDVTRMLGHTAFSRGHELKIDMNMLNHMIATISPRDQVMQHDGIVAHFVDGKLTVPKDLADQVFTQQNGAIHLRPGFQITADKVFGQVNTSGQHGGETSLYSIAADFHEGQIHGTDGGAVLPGTPPKIEYGPIPPTPKFVPPVVIEPPIAIPADRRRSIGDVAPFHKEDDKEDHKDDGRDTDHKNKEEDKSNSGHKKSDGSNDQDPTNHTENYPKDNTTEKSDHKPGQASPDSGQQRAESAPKIAESRGNDSANPNQKENGSDDHNNKSEAGQNTEHHVVIERTVKTPDDVLIDTHDWSYSIKSEQYRIIQNILDGINRVGKNFELKKHKFISDILDNVNMIHRSIRESLKDVTVGYQKDGLPVKVPVRDLKPEHALAFDLYLEKLERVSRARESYAKMNENSPATPIPN